MSKEFKIGLAVMVVVTVFLVFGLQRESRRPDPFSPRYVLLFGSVSGLRESDPVKVSGVPKGFVDSIEFATPEERQKYVTYEGIPPVVRVTVALQRGVRLPEGTHYRIYSNLKGYRWVEIMPAVSNTVLRPGSVLMAETKASTEDQLTRTLKTFKSLNQKTRELQDMVADAEFRRQVKDTASNMRFYSREFSRLSVDATNGLREIDRSLDEQEANLLQQMERADRRVDEIQRKLVSLAPRIRENLDDYNRRIRKSDRELQKLLGDVRKFTDDFDRVVDDVAKRYNESVVPDEIVLKVRGYARQLEDISLLAEDLHTLSSDPQVQADLKKIFTDLKERSEKLRTDVEGWQKTLDDLGI
ncbi:MAG: MlaD family protein [Candidatus Eremiobacterota bacterium]